jgi:phosphohistidine phosphatase
MHLLHLLRHAKSGRNAGLDDRERTLSKSGREAARLVAKLLPNSVGALDLVLCSSSVRTRETADLVLAGYSPAPRILFEDALYLAGDVVLLKRLRRLVEDCGSVLLIGHNPALHELAVALAAPGSPHFVELANGTFPTMARASLRIETSWAALQAGRNPLVAYATPNSLGIADSD